MPIWVTWQSTTLLTTSEITREQLVELASKAGYDLTELLDRADGSGHLALEGEYADRLLGGLEASNRWQVENSAVRNLISVEIETRIPMVDVEAMR